MTGDSRECQNGMRNRKVWHLEGWGKKGFMGKGWKKEGEAAGIKENVKMEERSAEDVERRRDRNVDSLGCFAQFGSSRASDLGKGP